MNGYEARRNAAWVQISSIEQSSDIAQVYMQTLGKSPGALA